MSWIAGLDLGQSQDPTALVVVERSDTEPALYDVRWIERFPLGSAYPAIVARVRTVLLSEPLCNRATLLVDGTGVGRAVVDLFQGTPNLMPVTITGGDAVNWYDGYWRVPKKDLVGCVQMLLQTGRLRIAQELAEAQTLVRELLGFQIKLSALGSDLYGTWREGAHDDCVLATALALWLHERQRPAPLIAMLGDRRSAGPDSYDGINSDAGDAIMGNHRSWRY